MDNLPRLHPDDLKELGNTISQNISNELAKVLGREQNLSKMQTFTVDEVAKLVSKNKVTILKHIEKKILIANKPGNVWIITQDALNDYINGKK
jgi:excisionase family DNA binding protein